MLPELLRDEIVNKRVDAAVETRQAQGCDVKPVQVVVDSTQQEAVVHQQHDVTGGEAQQEHDQHGDDQDDGLLAFLGDGLIRHAVPESPEHEDVGYDAHHSGKNKSQNSHGQKVASRCLHLAGSGDVVAGVDVEVCHFDLVVVQVQRDSDEPYHHPDGDGDSDSSMVAPLLPAQRVDHGPVTLHADAGDEGDGAVHVPVEKRHQHFAQPVSVDPVVAVEVVRDF